MNMELDILSRNIKFLRNKHGISQDELAATIHLARSTYSTYETGVKTPDLQTIDALAALYNIGFDSLVNHDLTDGLVHRIYFEQQDEDLVELLNDYLNLSIASKNLVIENLNILLEREYVFYQSYLRKVQESNGISEGDPTPKNTKSPADRTPQELLKQIT